MYATTSPITLDVLMAGHLRFMQQSGFVVSAVASPGPELHRVSEREGVAVAAVPMRRELSPLRDLVALSRLVRLIRSERPDVLNAGTPKAGLLGMLAGRIAGVPVRVYTVRGLRGETATGWRRVVLDLSERMASYCATDVVCVGPSLRALYMSRRLAPTGKTVVLGHGSSNGVDLDRFSSSPARRQQARSALGIEADRPTIGFVGRLVNDKGIGALVDAFDLVRVRLPNACLLLAGEFEVGDPVPEAVRRRIDEAVDIVHLGHLADAATLYPALDVLAFPSAREGLPNAPMEAAAAGIPTVAFDATGTRDVIDSGHSGFLVGQGDVAALADRLLTYLDNQALRAEHGANANRLAQDRFERSAVWENLASFYRLRLEAEVPRTTMASLGPRDLNADQGTQAIDLRLESPSGLVRQFRRDRLNLRRSTGHRHGPRGK